MATKIDKLLLKDARHGNGLLMIHRDKLLFAIGKKKFWKQEDERLVITYTCVGGTVERGETFLESAYREALEELGTRITISSVNNTLYYDFEARESKIVELEEDVNPIIVYNMHDNVGKLSVCVYLASPESEPKPSAEVPALLLLKASHLYSDKQLIELLGNSAEIIEQRQKEIPREAFLRPWGSAAILRDVKSEVLGFLLRGGN